MPIRKINPQAAKLRQNMTEAEKRMWYHVRRRHLGGFKFKRQWSIGPYVVDFCCIEKRLVLEIDGGQHSPEKDARRTAELHAMGYRVVRFWNNDVLGNLDGVLTSLLGEHQSHPHPGPLPLAGEGDQA
jgi:very-short-patch-repair endonuclease